MKFPRPIQILLFATCATCLLFAHVAHAQTSPPWWQQIITKAAEKAAQAAVHSTTTTQPAEKTGSTPITSPTTTASLNNAGAPVVSSISPNVILPFTRQTIIFRGSGFGQADPFNGPTCFLQLTDITNHNIYIGAEPDGFTGVWDYPQLSGGFYVTKWINTEIVVKGIFGPISEFHPGDLVRILIADPQNVNQYPVTQLPARGLCGSPPAQMYVHVASTLPGPKISSFSDGVSKTSVSGSSTTSVSTILPVATQTITINGSGFGTHAPFQGHSRFLQIRDITANNWTSGAACENGCSTGPSVDVTQWTDSQIVLGGFLSDYSGADVLHPGDIVRISIANPQLVGDMGSANTTFGGSPPTRIFVTVANPPSASQATTPMVPPATNATPTTSSTSASTGITSVTPIAADATPQVVLTGTDFGTFPELLPFTGDTQYLTVHDTTQKWNAGYIAPKSVLGLGGDACTVTISLWTNTTVVFTLNVGTNIGGVLPTSVCQLHPGDALQIVVTNPQSQQDSQINTTATTTLAMLFTPASGSYIAFSQQELTGLISNVEGILQTERDWPTSGTALVSVVPSETIDTGTVNMLTALIDLPTAAADGIGYITELGPGGVAFFVSKEALQYWSDSKSGGLTLPPVLVATGANSIISGDADFISGIQSYLTPASNTTCTGYVPEYVVGPGESLEVIFPGLTGQPSGTGLTSVSYKYRVMNTGGVVSGETGVIECSADSGATNYLQLRTQVLQ